MAKTLNEISVITVNFNPSLYSDCQLANVLYHYNHICIIVINIWLYFKLQNIFPFSYVIYDYQLSDTIPYNCNCSCNIVCRHVYILYYIYIYIYIYMFTNICMTYSTTSGSTRTVLHQLDNNEISHQLKLNWSHMKLGLSTLHNTRWHCPNLTIFTQNVCAWDYIATLTSPPPFPRTLHYAFG